MRENLTMRVFALVLIVLISGICKAQNPCEWSANVKDSVGEYKATVNQLVYERNFAGNSSQVYFSMAVTDGLPTLNVQFLQKSKDFIKANCLDKSSRLYLQLENGKIATLIHIDASDCGTGLRNDQMNNRILTGYFLFTKDAMETLKTSKVSYIRIKYSTETADYILKDDLTAETDGKAYKPSRYFMDVLPCLEN